MRARACNVFGNFSDWRRRGREGRECQEDDDDDDENKNRSAFRSRRDGRGEVWQQSTDCISLHWLWPSDEFDNGKEED